MTLTSAGWSSCPDTCTFKQPASEPGPSVIDPYFSRLVVLPFHLGQEEVTRCHTCICKQPASETVVVVVPPTPASSTSSHVFQDLLPISVVVQSGPCTGLHPFIISEARSVAPLPKLPHHAATMFLCVTSRRQPFPLCQDTRSPATFRRQKSPSASPQHST